MKVISSPNRAGAAPKKGPILPKNPEKTRPFSHAVHNKPLDSTPPKVSSATPTWQPLSPKVGDLHPPHPASVAIQRQKTKASSPQRSLRRSQHATVIRTKKKSHAPHSSYHLSLTLPGAPPIVLTLSTTHPTKRTPRVKAATGTHPKVPSQEQGSAPRLKLPKPTAGRMPFKTAASMNSSPRTAPNKHIVAVNAMSSIPEGVRGTPAHGPRPSQDSNSLVLSEPTPAHAPPPHWTVQSVQSLSRTETIARIRPPQGGPWITAGVSQTPSVNHLSITLPPALANWHTNLVHHQAELVGALESSGITNPTIHITTESPPLFTSNFLAGNSSSQYQAPGQQPSPDTPLWNKGNGEEPGEGGPMTPRTMPHPTLYW